MPFIAAGDITVHYDLTGPEGAPVVLFANSIGTSFHIWDAQAAALADRYRVLRYDMRGHGLSGVTPAPYSMDLLDALGIARAHVCGLSIGGMMAQRLAAKAPQRVGALVLCDTASRIGPPSVWEDRIAAIRAGGLSGIAQGVMARWFTERFRAERPAQIRGFIAMLSRTTDEGYIGCAMAIRDADLREDAARIATPTLVLVGDQDLATPPALAQELAEAIPGARFAVLKDAAHIPCVEQAEVLTGHLIAFLDETSAHGR